MLFKRRILLEIHKNIEECMRHATVIRFAMYFGNDGSLDLKSLGLLRISEPKIHQIIIHTHHYGKWGLQAVMVLS